MLKSKINHIQVTFNRGKREKVSAVNKELLMNISRILELKLIYNMQFIVLSLLLLSDLVFAA
jgi:hypothetical protein